MNKYTVGVLVSVLVGCAISHEYVAASGIEIERVDSRSAQIGYVSVAEEEGGVRVRGVVKRRPPGRGAIPGHIDIDVVAPSGEVTDRLVVNYQRANRYSMSARFAAVIENGLQRGTVIRLTHHADTRG